MNWMKVFDGATLEQAYEDWLEGCLEDFSITDGKGLAWVGDENKSHVVEFTLDSHQDPVGMTCDCPKALSGRPCKHMAVIYYQLDEDKNGFSLAQLAELSAPPFLDEYSLKNIHFLLGLCDPDLVSSFLLYLLNEDRSLLKFFWQGIYMNMPDDPDAVIGLLKDLVLRFKESHLFGDFDEAEVFINEAIRLFVFGSDLFQEKKDVAGLLDFSFQVFSELDTDIMDDHWGQLDFLCQNFLEVWKEVLEESGPPERQAMLDWYRDWQGIGGESIQLFNDFLEEFFSLPAFRQKGKELPASRQAKGTVQALFPEALLANFEREAIDLVSSASNRQHYQELVDFLREIQRFEGGKALVKSLVSRWRIEYKRRYALQEELDTL